MYSQNDEEKVICEFFEGQIGRLLDIGAWEGLMFSNSRRLLELGWSGVLVEPSPLAYQRLISNCEKLDTTLVNLAVAPVPGLVNFMVTSDAVSSMVPEHIKIWEKVAQYHEIWTWAITPRRLLKTFGNDFDFVNIDVEGLNVQVLEVFPFDEMPKLKLVCVEHGENPPAVAAIRDRLGFVEIHRTGENAIWKRRPK